MYIYTRFGLCAVILCGMLLLSCSEKKSSVSITQFTDPSEVTGIAPYRDAVYCATKGGLIKWETAAGKYTVFTTADGLPSNVLTDVVVDGDDILWIGTSEGLASYDGEFIRLYGTSHGLPSLEINDLSVDDKGVVWVGTTEGAGTFRGGRFSLLGDENGPGNQSILCIYFDLGNNIWIGTEKDGIFFKSEGTWYHNRSKDGLPTNTIITIAQAWDRSVWAASWAGIARWDNVGWKTFSSLDKIGTYEARYLVTTDNRFWYFTPNGVHASQGATWFAYTEEDGLISNDVISGYAASDVKVYAGTADGMSIIDNDTIENYFIPNSMVGHNCISLAIDTSDRVWIGTWETGLNLYDDGYWAQLRGKDETTLATVRSIVFPDDESIIFNTTGGIVTKKDIGWITETRLEGVSGNDVRCGVFDQKGRYWVGTDSGICFRSKGEWKRFRSVHGLPSGDTWACDIDQSGTLWFGTSGGIVSFEGTTLTDRTPEVGLGEVDIRSVCADGSRVLFGTNDGKLIVYDNGSWDVHGSRYLGIDSGIYAITVDSSGRTWLGTDGDGVVCITDGDVSNYTKSGGLPSNFVKALACQGEKLWVACYGGAATLELIDEGK